MIRKTIAWLILGICVQAAADEKRSVDKDFNLETTLNVPYVPVKPEESVDPQRTLDIYRPGNDKKAPVILYIHGGGWAFGDKKDVNLKPKYFALQGIAFVSMNYRLRWDYKVYDQLTDVVLAMKWIAQHGARYGLDSSRLVLMGHAAGGHLASLVITDSRYMDLESMQGRNIKAVISINSNSYDIPRLMRELGSFVERRQHELIFGTDPDVWASASPITHVKNHRGLPAFALLYEADSEASQLQAKGFAKSLSNAEVDVIMIPDSSGTAGEIDEKIGQSGNVATIALMAFIRSQI